MWRFSFTLILFLCGNLIPAAYGNGANTRTDHAIGYDITIDGDDRIIVGGFILPPREDPEDGYRRPNLALWRFDESGTPDGTLSDTDRFPVGGDTGGSSVITSLLIDGIGGLYAAATLQSGGNRGSVLLHILPDGTVDPGFGSSDLLEDVELMHLVSDGSRRILAVGSAWYGDERKAALWRFTSDGRPDPGFGDDGRILILPDYDDPSSEDPKKQEYLYASAAAVDPLGGYLVVGSRKPRGREIYQLALWRFMPDGTPDTDFGRNGRFFANCKSDGSSITVDEKGRILVTGSRKSGSGGQKLAVWCFNPDGSPDRDFGNRGVANVGEYRKSDFPSYGNDIAVDRNGRIVTVGFHGGSMCVWRFLQDGDPDPEFGNNGGIELRGTAGAGDDSAFGVAVDSRNRVVVTGQSCISEFVADCGCGSSHYVMATWRILPDGRLDPSFGTGGYVLYPESIAEPEDHTH